MKSCQVMSLTSALVPQLGLLGSPPAPSRELELSKANRLVEDFAASDCS